MCVERDILLRKTCVDEIDKIDKRLSALGADTYVPGDHSARGQEIARLAEQRESLLKEKRVLERRLAKRHARGETWVT